MPDVDRVLSDVELDRVLSDVELDRVLIDCAAIDRIARQVISELRRQRKALHNTSIRKEYHKHNRRHDSENK